MKEELKLNKLNTAILVGLSIFIIIGFVIYCMKYGFSGKEALMFIVTYYLANISVGLGAHRLWTHGSYKTTKVVEFILMLLHTGTLQGPVMAWASDHKHHHAYADTDKDPHTPIKYKNKIKGFLWAHMGWMLFDESTINHIDKHTMATLGKKRMLMWQLENYAALATFMNIIPPIICGWLVYGEITFQSSMAGLFTMGLARVFQQQITFCVNSLCHVTGSKKYANDSSGDVWWMFFLLLGENWHNFHHAFGRDYRNGHKWYHFDVHKWLIALLAKCGLAWDLVVTPKDRIEAVMAEMSSIKKTNWQIKLENIEKAAERLADAARQKVSNVEKSATVVMNDISSQAREKIAQIELAARKLAVAIQAMIDRSEEISGEIVKQQMKKLKKLEKFAASYGIKLA